ncbi:MAG: PAS domain S-box protein [Candidatus Marinimicrobia bacterium]|nr:PAS domain S-box protein [Candidatus Neomarinimicrobiota bacterium]
MVKLKIKIMEALKTRLSVRYVIALSLLAVVAIFGQALIQYSLLHQSDDSRIVNIAGRQRMLSQKVVKIVLSMSLSADFSENMKLRSELTETLDQWEKTHYGLRYEAVELGLHKDNSEYVKGLYRKIEPEFLAIHNAAIGILDLRKTEPMAEYVSVFESYIDTIIVHEKVFLAAMNDIVNRYETESLNKVRRLKTIGIILLILMLFVLLLVGFFVFKPAEQRIKNTIENLPESQSEEKYRILFEKSGDAILIIENGQFVDCNQATVNMLGYKNKQEILKTHPSELSPEKQPDGRDSFEKANEMMKIASEKGCHRFEWEYKKANDEIFPVEVLLTAISTVKGNKILHNVWRDISERKEADENLIKEKLFQEALLENAPEAIAALDYEGNVTNINGEFSRLFGYTLEEIKGKHINDLIIPQDLEDEGASYTKRTQSGERIYAETKRKHKDGSLVEVSLLGAPIFNAEGYQIGNYAIYRDLTESRNIQRLLSDKEKRLKAILETASNAIITIDVNGNIESFNATAIRIFGYSEKEVIGKNVSILMDESIKGLYDGNINEHFKTGESKIIGATKEVTGLRKNGEKFPAEIFIQRVDLEGEVIYVGLLNDITKQKKDQEERERLTLNLERARRMESLGILAGGVAHDLNNIIGPIVAYPDLILNALPPDTSVKSDLLAIKSAAERAADIIADLLALARRGKYDMEPLNLNDVVISYIESPEFKEAQSRCLNVKNNLELADDLYNVSSSASHLYKVILNIVNNAFDSMEDGGILSIRTFNEQVGSKKLAYEEIKEGLYAVLEVEDQGIGISKMQLGLIFDPFFTTKIKVGRRGSGLGLSVVHGIVKDHKGYVDVESQIGEGTKIKLYFPATKEQIIITPVTKNDYSGSETILAVDDDIEQLKMIDKLLSSLGYKVITAESGKKAIEQLKKEKADLVMLDMVMEDDFSGLDMYEEMLKLYPSQKAIIVSGYSETEQVRETIKLGAGAYIMKPFDINTIGKAVREELDKKDKGVT